MKRVRRLLAVMAPLALTATLTLGAPPAAAAPARPAAGPAAASPKPPASAPGVEYKATPGNAAEETPKRGMRTADMPIIPDDPRAGAEWLNDCLGSSDAQDFNGRVYNRFRWCQEFTLGAEYSKEVNGKDEVQGVNKITFQAAAIGYNDSRSTRVFFRTKPGTVKYEEWGPWDKRFTAPKLKLDITPECVPGANQPTTATCVVGKGPVRFEWAQWNNYSHWLWWNVGSSGGAGQDQVAYHQWRIHFISEVPPGYRVTARGQGAPNGIRCDSATYFVKGLASYPQACIYTGALPFITYDDRRPNIRQHIRDAQNAPATDGVTYPKENHPKKIPGKWSPTPGSRGAPLHRVVSRDKGGPIATENEYVKESACGQKKAINPWHPYYDATTGLPPYNTTVEDCDEYPFSSTYEGASSLDWDFSVRNIAGPENSGAGNDLQNFYVDDRILQWPEEDPFWVNVD
ncbi:NucA/NucB deoxyribonuclease domain-containing protein [Spirillospora sp. CA-253888]